MLTPLSWVYKAGMRVRNWSFEQGLRCVKQLAVPVVSVGNLTAGGTGKTPIVADLVQWSLDQGISVGVVSRGYKGEFTQVQRVPSHPHLPITCGDEPTMLARQFPQVPVFIHPDRVLAGQALLNKHQVQWILADDAFQHRRLYRDLNIVVFDATAPLWHLRSLPAGRAREPLSSLNRADFVILTKTNLVENALLDQWLQKLGQWVDSDHLICCEYQLRGLFPVSSLTKIEDRPKVWLVSGIGNPQSFEKLIQHSGINVLGHTVFPDHYVYRKKDVLSLCSIMKKKRIDFLVTTTKDLTKLSVFVELEKFLVEAKLDLEWRKQREKLDKAISYLIFEDL